MNDGRVCCSHGGSGSAGVAIFLPPKITYLSETEILPGRILLVKIEMNNEIFYLINVYNYTNDNYRKQVDFFNILRTFDSSNNLIIGGDQNSLMCIEKDRRSPCKPNTYAIKASQDLNDLCDLLELSDVYRLVNPDERKYTCRQKRRGGHISHSRIDLWLVSRSCLNLITSCSIKPNPHSDHSCVKCLL